MLLSIPQLVNVNCMLHDEYKPTFAALTVFCFQFLTLEQLAASKVGRYAQKRLELQK